MNESVLPAAKYRGGTPQQSLEGLKSYLVRAIEIQHFGEADVLDVVDIPPPTADDHQVLIDVRTAGINFADISRRRGTYDRIERLPQVLGAEVAGVRRDTGQRVVALTGGYGGYAEVPAVDRRLVFPVPDSLTDEVALALLLQGLTAYEVVTRSADLGAGETIAVHAAAGGVGSLAIQIASQLGAARIIGIASTESKRALVTSLGADAAIDSRTDGLAARIIAANNGQPVDVIAEMVGGTTFTESIAALATGGRIVTYGRASGADRSAGQADQTDTTKQVIDFSLPAIFNRPEDLASTYALLTTRVLDGELTPLTGTKYRLEQARQAHLDLQERRTVGKSVLDLS